LHTTIIVVGVLTSYSTESLCTKDPQWNVAEEEGGYMHEGTVYDI